MLGWRRKNEGFEWRDYVRTTIKLRREERAKKIDEIKHAAASGAKDVGRQGVTAGRHGVAALARWLMNAPALLWRLVMACLKFMQGCAVYLLRGIRHGIGEGPIGRLRDGGGAGVLRSLAGIRVSVRTKIGLLFGVLAAAAALSAYLQYVQTGPGWSAILSAAVALSLAGLAIAPWLSQVKRPSIDDIRNFGRGVRLPFSWSMISTSALRGGVVGPALGALGAVVVVVGAGYWAWQGGAISATSNAVSSMIPFSSSLPNMAGQARAVSGDTVRVGRRFVRLAGIEAPEVSQVCEDQRGRTWRCGRRARDVLDRMLRRGTATCTGVSKLQDGLLEATCKVRGEDLAEQLVETGSAFAQGLFLKTYANAEEKARTDRRGIWQGDPLRPADYRAKRWAAASKSAPEGCPIKGQVLRAAKVYVLPWASDYRQIRVRSRHGGRWFCSETEATNAGFKPSPTG